MGSDAKRPKQVTAQDLANAPLSATFEFQGSQLQLIVGGSSGNRVLKFQGKNYPFTAKGLSAGGIGFNEVHAVGTVLYMRKIEDFAGRYTGVTMGATAVKGKGTSTFENGKGVILSVKSKSEGLALSLSVRGGDVEMVK